MRAVTVGGGARAGVVGDRGNPDGAVQSRGRCGPGDPAVVILMAY